MICGTSALGIGVLLALPAALPASAAADAPGTTARHLKALYDVGVHPGITAAQARASALAGTTVPEYTATVKVGTKNFTYTIVGKNPADQGDQPVDHGQRRDRAVIMKFSNGDTWNPTDGRQL